MKSEGARLNRVRIFSLDDSVAVELPARLRGRPEANEESHGTPVVQRRREETAIRNHVFLDQTVPPSNPVVLESERRRSGGVPND